MLVKEHTEWTADNSFLLEYTGKIEYGEIIAGQELWMELCSLREDLRTGKYAYDTADARLRMDFMESCVRLTKSPYYNKPMVLMLWQKAFIETVYSFRVQQSGLRRFKKVILLIARKNTKSETCSALGITEFFLGNPGADIVCSSNDDNQASIIYDTIDTMRLLMDPEGLDTHRNQRFILNRSNNTKIFKLSDKTRNKEGRNIDVAFLDESHEMKDNVIAKSIEQSQSLKDEPLFVNLTTEGFVVDGYLDGELEKGRKVIRGEMDGPAAEELLPWYYTQDSEQEIWQNRASWVKSNPTLGTVKKWAYLDAQVDMARQSKPDRIFTLAKDFNIKQNNAQAWLNLEDYTYEAVYDLEDFRSCKCLGAVDLSETTDLTSAKILMMKPGDKVKHIHAHYFIPESKLEDSDDRNAGAKYREWAKEGLLTITEGNDIDLSVVADWFYGLYKDFNLRLWKCGYDQKFALDWIKRMEMYGWTRAGGELVMVLQNAQTMNNAIRLLEADLKHRLVNYNENKMDRWCMENACLKVDEKGMCLIVKGKEKGKRIDGAVCMAILYEMYRQNRTEWRQMTGDT